MKSISVRIVKAWALVGVGLSMFILPQAAQGQSYWDFYCRATALAPDTTVQVTGPGSYTVGSGSVGSKYDTYCGLDIKVTGLQGRGFVTFAPSFGTLPTNRDDCDGAWLVYAVDRPQPDQYYAERLGGGEIYWDWISWGWSSVSGFCFPWIGSGTYSVTFENLGDDELRFRIKGGLYGNDSSRWTLWPVIGTISVDQ